MTTTPTEFPSLYGAQLHLIEQGFERVSATTYVRRQGSMITYGYLIYSNRHETDWAIKYETEQAASPCY